MKIRQVYPPDTVRVLLNSANVSPVHNLVPCEVQSNVRCLYATVGFSIQQMVYIKKMETIQ